MPPCFTPNSLRRRALTVEDKPGVQNSLTMVRLSFRATPTPGRKVRRFCCSAARPRDRFPVLLELTCPVGFYAKRAWEILSGLENGGQRRARFLHS
jgi:hypothetical protein